MTARFRQRYGAALAGACAIALAFPAAAQPMNPGNPPTPREHAATIEAYGGLYEGPVAAYVAEVGQRVALAAERRGCGFYVVNTPVVNAFTSPPGCHVYVTRGLVALLNSEDELAAVLGHEVGHVAANHAGRRQQRSVLTGLGALILGAVTGSGQLANIASQFGQLNVLSYSRNQEFESDSLAVRYLTRSGYSPEGLVGVLEALQAQEQLQQRLSGREERTAPAWAQTHPLHADRIARAAQHARAAGPTAGGPAARPDALLRRVDGLLYGDDPRQGFVEGRRFTHPDLGVAFEAPPGFTLANGSRAVRIEGPEGAVGQFAAGRLRNGDLEGYAQDVLRSVAGQAQVRAGQPQRTRINGLPAVVLPAIAQGQSGAVEVTVAAYETSPDTAYHFVTLAAAGRGRLFDPLIGSFRRLDPREARGAGPRRIEVVTVRPGETAEGLASRMALDEARVEHFRLLNGLGAGEPVRAGRQVKLVVHEQGGNTRTGARSPR